MKVKFFLLVVMSLLLANTVNSQPAETTYLGTVIKEGSANDVSYGPFNIGFSFNYYGNAYTQFYVSTNGLVTFGSGSSVNSESNIPSTTIPDNFIAPFWDDLKIDGFGDILYSTTGAGPNRKLVIQFRNMGFYPAPIYMGTFSVILYETSDKIQIQYRMIVLQDAPRGKGGDAAIGIENNGGTSGIEFAYHNPSAVNSWKAISFTPSGPMYNVNPDAVYEGIYLTKNLTLPEPAIADLISPANGSTVGVDVAFLWNPSEYTTLYSMRMADNPEMTGATTRYSGTDLTATVTGLIPGQTYYWTILTSNSTGFTWNEVKKFTVSAIPPLTAIPQTVWAEQNTDRSITLNYTGGDAGPKTAIITSLPSHGQLFQYNAGTKGSQIVSVPAPVTDGGKKVIYNSQSDSGNGIGNFNFKMNDGTGDSPEAAITVNVSPPGIPAVLYVAKSSGIEIQFDRRMADPAGKHNQFNVTVNGSAATLMSAALKTGDPYTIMLTLSPALSGTETVLVAYTQGDVVSEQGAVLLSFSDIPVTLKSQIINFTQTLDKKISQSPFSLTANASSGLGLTYSSSNLGVATISGNVVTLRSTGSSDITARQAGNSTWAPAKYVRTLSVSKDDQAITFNVLPSKTFGDSDFSLTATASSGLPVSFASSNPAVATVAGNSVHITGAGSTVITASQAGNSLWNPAPDVPQTLTVNKATASLTLSNLNQVYNGQTHPASAATIPPGLTVDLTYNGLSSPPVNAGSYTVSATINDINYQGTSSDVLNIGKSMLTVTADDQTRAFGEDNPVFTISYSGFASGEDVNVLDTPPIAGSSAGVDSEAGSYSITVSGASDNNYDFTYADGVLTITKAIAGITLGNLSAIYDGLPHQVTITTIPASLTVELDYSGSAEAPVNAGVYEVTATVNDINYEGTVTGNLNINKATLTFTANNKSRDYLAANPQFTWSVSGFIGNETESVLDQLPVAQSIATLSSPVGTYPITISGGADNNYTYIYTIGTLTINRIQQMITITDIPGRLLAGNTYSISGTSTSGLDILFESLDSDIATITGNQITGISKGTVQVRAFHPGDNNYYAAEAIAEVEIYTTHKDIMYLFTPNNDSFNDYWELPEIASWGKCEVRVYNRWGKLVFADDDYHNLWDGTSEGSPLPEGAYYFIISTENAGTVKGTVNIVR